MFSRKTEEIRPIFGAPVNFFLLYFVTQITQIFPSSISYSADETCSVRLRRFFLQLYLVTQIFLLFFFLSHRLHRFAQIFPTPFPITPWDFSQMERNGRGKGGKIWKTTLLLCIFAPGVEKAGQKIQAAVDRKLLSKTLFTLHRCIVNN